MDLASKRQPFSPVVVDLAADEQRVVEALRAGCEGLGFFYLDNHGIPEAVIGKLFEQSAAFFNQAAEAKAALAASNGAASGFHAAGTTGTAHRNERAPNQKEMHRLALTDVDVAVHPAGAAAPACEQLTGAPAAGVPLWPQPSALPSFQPVVLRYFEEVSALFDRLLHYAALSLGLPADALLREAAGSGATPAWHTLARLHYPAVADDAAAGQFALSPHKDRFCAFTLLANTPGSGGLEALDASGAWVSVPPREGALIINVGYLLEHWSAGRYPAVLHSVINPHGQERYSAALFRGAAADAVLRPLVGGSTADSGEEKERLLSAEEAAHLSVAMAQQGYEATSSYPPLRCGDFMSGFSAAFARRPLVALLPEAILHLSMRCRHAASRSRLACLASAQARQALSAAASCR